MKFLIIGLGNFGASLGEKLTLQGHEVIGVDKEMSIVENYKERISHTICMDATDENAVSGLPLKSTDVVVVAIGEDQGANLMTSALIKNLELKRLISRAINPLHEKVLKAIGVTEIVHPEAESAERWSKKLCLTDVVNSFELSEDYSILEVNVPERFFGKTIRDIELRPKYNLLALTTIKQEEVKSLVGKTENKWIVKGVASAETLLNKGDILVVYGSKKDLLGFTNPVE